MHREAPLIVRKTETDENELVFRREPNDVGGLVGQKKNNKRDMDEIGIWTKT